MKLSIILAFCVLSACRTGAELELPPEFKDLLDNLHTVCSDETKVDPSVVDAARKGDFKEDGKFKCFLKCIMQQMQAMTEEGQLDMDLIESSIPEEFQAHGALETIHKCKSMSGADACETAFLLVKCFHHDNAALSSMFE